MGIRSRTNLAVPNTLPSNPVWNKPSDWLSLGTPTTNQIKILFGVWDHDSNFAAIRCSGACSYDWGDGTAIENVAAGTLAQHNYNFANVGNTTSQGFRQAVITITPQAANNITAFRINEKNATDTNTSTSSTYGFLEIVMNCPNLTTLNVGTATTTNTQIPRLLQNFEMQGTISGTLNFPSAFYNCVGLRKCTLITTGLTGSSSNLFNSCRSLTEVNIGTMAGATSIASIFLGCYSLVVAPPLAPTGFCDTAFQDCYSLTNISPLNLASATSTYQMFIGCRGLVNVGNIDARSSLDGTSMFGNCTSMRSIGNIDLRSDTAGVGLLGGCVSLKSAGNIDVRARTNLTSLLNGCTSLLSIGTITNTAATNHTNILLNCTSIQNAPTFSQTANVTNWTAAFSGCASLINVPIYTIGAANLSDCFNGCLSLEIAPAWNYSAITTGTNLFAGCRSMSKGIIANAPAVSHSYANCKLSSTAINAVFTALPTATATITINTNYGSGASTPSIATAKNWTVA